MEQINPYVPVDGTDMLGKDAQRVREYFVNEHALTIPFAGECQYPRPDGEIAEELGIARSYIVRVRKHYNIPDVETRRKSRFVFLQETAKNYCDLYVSGVNRHIELENRRLKDEASACTVGCIIGAITGMLLGILLF